jgi:type III secretion protein T
MIDPLQNLILADALGDSVENIVVSVAVASIRLFAVFNVLPPTNAQFLQGLSRAGVVVMLAFFVAMGMPADGIRALSAGQWLGLVAKEALIGLVIGFAASSVFWVAESVGAMFDTQAGYNSVQLNNPMTGQQSTPVSAVLLQFVVGTFYAIGGLTAVVGVVFESYRVWPPLDALPSLRAISEVLFVQQVDSMMTAVLKFSAPVLIILLLIDLGFGLMTRSADKLEPSSLSQPIKGAVTLLLMSLLVGMFVQQVRSHLLPTGLLQGLRGVLG